jgi:aminopeptidase N
MKKTLVLVLAGLCLVTLAQAYIPNRDNPEAKRMGPGWQLTPADNHDSLHAYDIRYYGIDMNLPMNNGSMTGHNRVTVTSRRTGLDTVAFHMVSLVCDSVRIAGAPATFTTPSGLLVVNLDRAYDVGESLDVDLYYHRTSGTANRGFYWYTRAQSGYHVIAYSTTEPANSRYWFPCFDEPWDKAEQGCAINVTVPETLSVASNGLLDSVTSNSSAHTKTFWWRERYSIPTYLMTFAASKWANFKQWFHLSPTESSYIWNFVWPEDSVQAQSSFGRTVDMMDFFDAADRFGRYPFEKYGMVEAYPFEWGGMENQTMTMVHNYWVTSGSDNGIAHEMSHQWWGDMVTCLDWRNIWLNEGFGTFSDELYYYHQNGRAQFINLMNQRAQDYISEEAGDLHPIYNPPFPDHLFDWGHSYCKGSWVMRMLQYVENDTVFTAPGIFYQALRAYGDSFKYGCANTDDYCRINEQMTGMELSWFFNEWVYMAGYPKYTVNWRSVPDGGGGYWVFIHVRQNNGAQAPSCFHMPLQISLRATGRDTLVTVPIDTNPQDIQYHISFNATSISVDPGSWILKSSSSSTGIDDALADRLSEPLEVSPTLAGRAAGFQVSYANGQTGPVRLAVFDELGRKVRTLVNRRMNPGLFSATWNGTDDAGRAVAPGVYFCRLLTGVSQAQQKVVVGAR